MEQAIVRHVNFLQIKCLLLGSPGFVKDDFFEFLNLEAVRREERVSCVFAKALVMDECRTNATRARHEVCRYTRL